MKIQKGVLFPFRVIRMRKKTSFILEKSAVIILINIEMIKCLRFAVRKQLQRFYSSTNLPKMCTLSDTETNAVGSI